MLPLVARPKSFDRGAVVASAMQVFWREGYQGASLSSLGPAMESISTSP